MIEFTLCETTGQLATPGGSCFVHFGDACLKQFIRKQDAFDAFASMPVNEVRLPIPEDPEP